MKQILKKEITKLSLEELIELEGEVALLVSSKQKEAKAELKAKIQEMVASSGLSVEEVLDIKTEPELAGKAQKRKSPKPKYQNPSTGETWSGRGRMPRWLASLAEEKEVQLDDPTEKKVFLQAFLIEKAEDPAE